MAMKKEAMGKGMTCDCSHHGVFKWVILIIGLLYLSADLGWWDFWNIQWWTVAFILVGLGSGCKCCGKWC